MPKCSLCDEVLREDEKWEFGDEVICTGCAKSIDGDLNSDFNQDDEMTVSEDDYDHF